MAIYFWRFSAGWTVYLVCLLIVQSTSTLHDELYFKYDTLDSAHRSVAELNFDLIDKGIGRSRHKRFLDDANSEFLVSHISSIVNSSLSSQSSNAALNNKPSYSGNLNNNAHSVVSHDIPNNGGLVHEELSSSTSELNRLQTLRQATRIGPVLSTPTDPSSSGSSTNPSVNSSNNNTYTLPNPGQIISATFEPKPKTGIAVGSAADPWKDKDSDISITQFPDEISDSTLKKENITKSINDHHIYYNSTFSSNEKIARQYWVDLSSNTDVKIHDMLSQSHRRAATVQLSFDFPFYGHSVTNITIATGGFLFTGDHIHSWLAATQYIAPLMANFDNRISDDSYIKYLDNGTAFIVLWENVILKDSPESGNFSFEAILHKSGDIVFVYKNIPIPVENIKDDQHPVKVGLSDAYIIDRTIFFVKRKTIYEYHRVNFSKEDIKNWTVIYLNALPTCHDMKDCESCTNANISLECKWCPAVERCSTGLDRARQEWLSHECDKMQITTCNESPPPPYAHKAAEINIVKAKLANEANPEKARSVLGTSGVISMLLVMTSLAAAAFIFLYAYRNPHSAPGQILIRYRPSQWRFRRGEARYTAATIHM